MTILSFFQFAWRSLWKRPLRTVLTTIGVTIGATTIVLLVSLGSGIDAYVTNQIRTTLASSLKEVRVFPYAPSSDGSLVNFSTDMPDIVPIDTEDIATFRALSHVQGVLADFSGLGVDVVRGDKKSMPSMLGVLPKDVALVQESRTLHGTWFTDTKAKEVVVGKALATALGVDDVEKIIGTTVEISVPDNFGAQTVPTLDTLKTTSYTVKIVGVLDAASQTSAFSSTEEMWLPFGLAEDMLTASVPAEAFSFPQVVIRVDDVAATADVAKAVQEKGFAAIHLEDVVRQVRQVFVIGQVVLGALGGIALLVSLFGIANTMIMAVLERTREIGLLKSLGMSGARVLWLFLAEAGAIGLFGGLAGLGIAWGLGVIISKVLFWYATRLDSSATALPQLFVIHWWLVVGMLLFTTVLSLLAGLYPAWRASRMSPVEALRSL